jgi:hypothetical protein
MFVEHSSATLPCFRSSQNHSNAKNMPPFQARVPVGMAQKGAKKRLPRAFILPPCLCLLICLLIASPASSAQVTLAWDANQEADLAGYRVYLNSGSPGPPYDLYRAVALSNLRDPNHPQLRVGSLKPGYYCFSLTAFDSEGNESDFSRPACAEIYGSVGAGVMLLLPEE